MNTENNININNVLNVNDVQIACSEVSGNALSKSISDPEKEKQFSPFSVGGIHTIQSHLVYSITKPRKIKTGIPELSNAIGGGYPVGGLTVIGGVPNVGKTTIAVQSAVKMSKEGVPSVFLSLDMSGYEIIDKVYSQLSYQEYGLISYSLQDISKKKFVVNNEENLNLLKKVSEVCRYFTVVDMYDKEKIAEIIGVLHAEEDMFNKIVWLLELYTNIYKHPVIFIDNLQQLSGYSGADGKAGVDKSINFLKEVARKYEVPIVLISTMGRASYDKTIELSSFKESGNIDYAVSCAVGLEPKFITDNDTAMDIDTFRTNPKRDITIKCVKSRDSGFEKKYITLNAPYCTFEPYDESRPNNASAKRKGNFPDFVDSVHRKVS